jgi:hypothetical protein
MPSKKKKQEKLQVAAKQFGEAVARRDEKFGDTALLTLEELQCEGELLKQDEEQLSHEVAKDGSYIYKGLTEVRLTVFLHTLAETGSLAAAARRATPWSISRSKTKRSGMPSK